MKKMDPKVYIEYEGTSYCFKNDDDEDLNMFYDRCLYIIKNKNVPNIANIAKIWVYKKYYGVSYSKDIEKYIIN